TSGALRIVHPQFSVEVLRENGLPVREGEPCMLGVRPEDVHLTTHNGEAEIEATVYVTEPLGGETVVDLRLGDRPIKALAPAASRLAPDQRVSLRLDPRRLHVFAEDGSPLLSAAGAESFALRAAPRHSSPRHREVRP